MLILPDPLLARTRTTLLNCREFESYQTLRAIFVTEHLFPFRIGLPSKDSIDDLVDAFLDYILPQKLIGGHPVLPLFLATLRDRYEIGIALRDELERLHIDIQVIVQSSQTHSAFTPPPKHILFDHLLRFDFRSQVRMVNQVIQQNRIAAFLIHGQPDYGQRLLTHRLTRLRPTWATGQHIIIDAASNGCGKNSQKLWREVANRLQMPFDTAPTILAEKVCQWWETQDVIFIFQTVDYMPPDLLVTWLDEFWYPLVDAALQHQNYSQSHTHLLMFMVDFEGKLCNSDLFLQEVSENLQDSYTLRLLPALREFPETELDILIDGITEILPPVLNTTALLATTQNGIPELVYNMICKYCGISWEGELAP